MCQPGRPRPQGLSQPGRFVGRWLPQNEIHRVLFVWRNLDPCPGDHVIDRTTRQRAVVLAFHAVHSEQNMPLGCIGVAFGNQSPRSSRSSGRYTRVARGISLGSSAPKAPMSCRYQPIVSSERSCTKLLQRARCRTGLFCRARAVALILSSTSVKLRT